MVIILHQSDQSDDLIVVIVHHTDIRDDLLVEGIENDNTLAEILVIELDIDRVVMTAENELATMGRRGKVAVMHLY